MTYWIVGCILHRADGVRVRGFFVGTEIVSHNISAENALKCGSPAFIGTLPKLAHCVWRLSQDQTAVCRVLMLQLRMSMSMVVEEQLHGAVTALTSGSG